MTLSEIQQATLPDPKAELQLFSKIKGVLTVNSDKTVILHGNRIAIPATLQKRAMMLDHEGHQGTVKTKKLLRKKVRFRELK